MTRAAASREKDAAKSELFGVADPVVHQNNVRVRLPPGGSGSATPGRGATPGLELVAGAQPPQPPRRACWH
jgi:hypothetical protein